MAIEESEPGVGPIVIEEFRLVALDLASTFAVDDVVSVNNVEVTIFILERHSLRSYVEAVDLGSLCQIPIDEGILGRALCNPNAYFIGIAATSDSSNK